MVFHIVYDKKSTVSDIINYLTDKGLEYITYDNDNYKQLKKGRLVKSHCAARLNPFVAVFDNKLIKAFYTEAKEVNLYNIERWINENNIKNGNTENQ